jgi:hypothetical protein
VDPFSVAALADHDRAPILELEVAHVETEDFLRPRGGLIDQPPQCALTERNIATSPKPLKFVSGYRPCLVA